MHITFRYITIKHNACDIVPWNACHVRSFTFDLFYVIRIKWMSLIRIFKPGIKDTSNCKQEMSTNKKL